MKQLLILMAFLLALMLLLFGVMAVGNAKQSVQIADRVQQLSNLKAELRSAQKENRTLTGELEAVQVQNRKLRWEQQAVAQQLSGLLPAAGELPVLPQTAGGQPAGELLLEAMAVRRLAAVGTAESALGKEGTPLPTEAAAAGGRICWAADGLPADAKSSSGDGVATAGGAALANGGVATAGGSAVADSEVAPVGGSMIADSGVATVGGAALADGGVAPAGGSVAADSGSNGKPAAGTDAAACRRRRESCGCAPGSLEANRGTVLAVSEPLTIPAASLGSTTDETAAAVLPILQRQAQQIDHLLHDLLGMVQSLAERILSMPLGAESR